MKGRLLLMVAALCGGFVALTMRPDLLPQKLARPFENASPFWKGPDSVRSAGLSPDEQNNIDIYKHARNATVNVTSTVYRQTWFMEVIPSQGLGSGFIISDDGKILTNNHVISGSREIVVTLADQTQYPAQVLGRDPANDLALIKIQPKKKLSILRLGDSDPIQVGQKVLAIGNPFGLDGTLTTGIVSAVGRTIREENGRSLEGLMQTDAAINSGNSGGPLLDSGGNVIGINTAIYGPNGGNVGIGFAMPVNRAKSMLDTLQSGRKPSRPRLGVSVVYVAGDLANALGLPREGGLLIQDVARGSAAEQARLRGPREVVVVGNSEVGVGGDLILAIDGRSVDRPDAISRAIARKRAGDTVQLTLYRGQRNVNVTVTLGESPDEQL